MSTTTIPTRRSNARIELVARASRWSVDAWASIAVVLVFLGITFWWLTQDRSIPIFDAGLHLTLAIYVYEQLHAGQVGHALTVSYPYPPFSYVVGALGFWIGGLGVAPPIIAQNLVFVPLLALGCYNVGRLAFGTRAGLLAVVFALGSPLIMAQFHVAMTDAPQTAMVAVTVWLILASERFSHVAVSAAAGVAAGLGMVTKEPFAFFVAGVVIVTAIRGGWRSWRGMLAFALPLLAIALPWYISIFSHVGTLAEGVAYSTGATYEQQTPGVAPARFSAANLTWYFWNITNFQLYAPLFAFTLIGAVWTLVGLVRRRPISPFSWELVFGAFFAWFAITQTFVHDTRYSMPLLLYLAVFGSCWIVRLPRPGRLVATGALVLIAIANTLATSFGVGGVVKPTLAGAKPHLLQQPGVVTLYSNVGFLVAGPQRDGDVLALMRAMYSDGAREIAWFNIGKGELPSQLTPIFSNAGLVAFTQMSGLKLVRGRLTAGDVVLGHGPIKAKGAPPCIKLSDNSGVWVRLGPPDQPGIKDYCPFPKPHFYSISG